MKSKITFPRTLKDWYYKGDETFADDLVYVKHVWLFLRPFFASRGYAMYQQDAEGFSDLNPPPFPPVAKTTSYPYARQVPCNQVKQRMAWSIRMWPARDILGRDVVIKVISEVGNPSPELEVMKRLNSKGLRSDPANHTIYAIEFITFDKFIFVVMPRWDSAFLPDFATVSETMSLALTCFQNIGMNAVMDSSETIGKTGMRDPAEVRYALFDFGASITFPEDTDIEEASLTRYNSFALHDVPDESVKYPYNPFKLDMAFLGTSLQTYVRHLEPFVPQLGPFFDSLVDMNNPNQLSASQALACFTKICDGLSPDIAQVPLDTRVWSNGVIEKKDGELITVVESL
ncbi:hypothetical protein JR316_0003094 [Psilocybe cubensis]|uniref:Uncharacterized protein n=2 Tax=Psilocybe cubensis TaxID=181762 RepID=A0ACB8H713_PSICU|nr:hypothetical protein JR316_0003094 [Psilocybe cubensis]KAH9483624.1 hypothetical protein JR316_0003094 [Psilocybe cubensis]